MAKINHMQPKTVWSKDWVSASPTQKKEVAGKTAKSEKATGSETKKKTSFRGRGRDEDKPVAKSIQKRLALSLPGKKKKKPVQQGFKLEPEGVKDRPKAKNLGARHTSEKSLNRKARGQDYANEIRTMTRRQAGQAGNYTTVSALNPKHRGRVVPEAPMTRAELRKERRKAI